MSQPETAQPALAEPHRGDDGPLVAHALRGGTLQACYSLEEIAASLRDPQARVWVDVESASDETVRQLGAALGLHTLIVEDIIEREQRPKVELTDGTLHIVLFALTYLDEIESAEIDIVLGERFLLTAHPPTWRPLKTPHIALRGVAYYLEAGIDALLYAVVDPIVDGYGPIIDRLSDEIDQLEDLVLRRPDTAAVERLFRVRRSLLEVRHRVSAERDIFSQLTDRSMGLVADERLPYFRDLHDHVIRVTEELDIERELLNGALEAYLSTVNNNLSAVMKRLTAVTAVLATVGAVAGIFGMSEASSALGLPSPWGLWVVTGVVVVLAVVVLVWLRRIDWI